MQKTGKLAFDGTEWQKKQLERENLVIGKIQIIHRESMDNLRTVILPERFRQKTDTERIYEDGSKIEWVFC